MSSLLSLLVGVLKQAAADAARTRHSRQRASGPLASLIPRG